ncbi:MAG: hypothetical protein K6A94_00020 [Bacteroidales bacterium]|nr:hypothetical protein [Bacteroidales bacterium]
MKGTIMEDEKKNEGVVNHFEKDSNCQVFNGDITGCVFAMPGSQVTQQTVQPQADNNEGQQAQAQVSSADSQKRDEKLCFFVHPAIDESESWRLHDEIKRLVTRQGIQEICQHLMQLSKEKKLLLPQSADKAYEELRRMGMPSSEGFSKKTFMKYYRK